MTIKILITGGSGFIGSNLIKKLLNLYDDIKILSLDNYLTGIKENELLDKRVIYINDSTVNIEKYIFFKPDIVYHFGEYSRISQSFEEPQLVIENNILGTSKVIDYCIKNKSLLIYSCSSAILGNDKKDSKLSPYCWTKAKNLELIELYKEWFGLKYIILYFYNVFGVNQISRGLYATVIGVFEEQYKNNESLTVVLPGIQQRSFTHIDDTINGIIIGSIKGELYNSYYITNDKQYSILDVVKLFNTKYKFIKEKKGDRLVSTGNNKDLKNLGWKIQNSLEDYIENLVKEKENIKCVKK